MKVSSWFEFEPGGRKSDCKKIDVSPEAVTLDLDSRELILRLWVGRLKMEESV